MANLLHECLHRSDIGSVGFIGNHVGEVFDPKSLTDFVEIFPQEVLQVFGHPDNALVTTFGRDELAAGDVGLAYADESRYLLAAAGRVGQGGKLHSGRSFAQVFAIDDHDAVNFGHQGDDGLKATATGHWVFQQRVGIEARQRLLGIGVDVVVDVGPLSAHRIDALALDQRLIGAGRIDLVGCLAVQPVVSAAQSQPFRGDDANMVGSKALTEQAGVEGVNALVGERLHALIAGAIGVASHVDPLRRHLWRR